MTKILNYKNNYSEIKKNMENSNTKLNFNKLDFIYKFVYYTSQYNKNRNKKRRFYETFKKNLDYVGETLRMEIKPS